MARDPEELDARILQAIRDFDGVPNPNAIEKTHWVDRKKVKKRITANPEIGKKMEARGREWLDGLGEREFLKKYRQGGWGRS